MRRERASFAAVILAAPILTACVDPENNPVRVDAGPPRAAFVSPAVSTPFDTLLARGEAHHLAGDLDSARAVWHTARDRVLPGDTAGEARVLTWMGLTAWRAGDHAAARRHGERALALKRAARLGDELSVSYNALALLAWTEGRYADAAGLGTEAVWAARSARRPDHLMKAANTLGLVRQAVGEFSAARADFETARTAGRAAGHARTEAAALTNLGALAVAMGDPAAALRVLDTARALYRAIGYRTGEENALGQLGTAHAALGDPRRALAYLDSALTLARALEMRQQEAEDLALIGELYQEVGDHERALHVFAEARARFAALGLDDERANVLRTEAAVFATRGAAALPAAHARLDEAIRVHRGIGARLPELRDLVLRAEIAGGAGRTAEAERSLREAGRLAAALDAALPRALVALARARVADHAGDPAGALRALDGARVDIERAAGGADWEAHVLRAAAYERAGRLDSAIAAGRRAVAAVERTRWALASAALRAAFAANRARAYEGLVRTLLRAGRIDEGLAAADAARARTLAEQAGAAGAGIGARAGATLVDADRVLRRIDALLTRLRELEELPGTERGPSVASTAAELTQRLAAARQEYDALLVRFAEGQPRAASVAGARALRVAELRAALRPDEALIEYLVTPDRVIVFAVDRQGVRADSTPHAAADLSNRVRLARSLLESRAAGRDEARPVSGELHKLLLGPVMRTGVLRGKRRLIVVPHAALSYLPWGALRDPATGRALLDDFHVSVVPSAATLVGLRAGAGAPDRVGRAAILVPYPQRLPATAHEGRTVRREVGGAALEIGPRATEAALRRALQTADLVHVASHGVMNARSPLFSRIELAPGSGASFDDNGRLEVHELLGMHVRSTLVFLSGCETGLGAAWSTDFARGEDYTTLAQSFLYAGARGVVATLWRVDDAGAAAFAERFYRHRRLVPAPEALARAQRDLRADPRYRHPFYWAAYVLTGDG